MYKSLITLVGALTLSVSATPIDLTTRTQSPYFEVRNFSMSRTETSSRYLLYVDFPESVTIDDGTGTVTVPAFTEPVACTGTYFGSPTAANTTTLINACGAVGDGKTSAVTTRLETGKGNLSLRYLYNATVDGEVRSIVFRGAQRGLEPVSAESPVGFNTPACGPATD